MTDKFILKGKNGKPDMVGVILDISGGGEFSTQKYLGDNPTSEQIQEKIQMAFDPKLIKLIRRGLKCDGIEEKFSIYKKINEYCNKTYGVIIVNTDDLVVQYIPVGSVFMINEPDDYNNGETIIMQDEEFWMTA